MRLFENNDKSEEYYMHIIAVAWRNFWLLGACMNLINLIIIGVRLKKIKNNNETISIKGILIRYSLLLVIPFIFLGVFQIMGGYNNPFYFLSQDINIFLIFSWITFLIFYGWFFYWINFKNGIVELSYINENKFKLPEGMERLIFNLLIIVSVLMLIIGIYSNIYVEIERHITHIFNGL